MPSNLFSMDSNGYRFLLPEGTLDYFDLVDVQETCYRFYQEGY